MVEKVHFYVDEHAVEVVPTRRKGSIALKVEPNRIALLVPSNMTAESLQDFILTQHDWFRNQIQQRHTALPKITQLENGAEVRFQGEYYHLNIREAGQNEILLNRTEKQIEIECKWNKRQQNLPLPSKYDLVKKRLFQWYKNQFMDYLTPRVSFYSNQLGVSPTELKVRSYKSRWGSCYPDGRMQFNWRLVMAPNWVVDYVVVHELCHLVHQNHSKQFWALVDTYYPDRKKAQTWLKENGTELIHF